MEVTMKRHCLYAALAALSALAALPACAGGMQSAREKEAAALKRTAGEFVSAYTAASAANAAQAAKIANIVKGDGAPAANAANAASAANAANAASAGDGGDPSGRKLDEILTALEELAAAERLNGYSTGMYMTESMLRESLGDYAGAVGAAFKELSMFYGYGTMTKDILKGCLKNVFEKTFENGWDFPGGERGLLATQALTHFLDGEWEQASLIISSFPVFDDEPDGFFRWMLLVCEMETGPVTQAMRSAYGAIRARFNHYPEYWYRGARAMTGYMAGEYAERCINIAPSGPFVEECRRILAVELGLSAKDGPAMLTRMEIDGIVSGAAGGGKPDMLAPLFPALSLPDNAATLYMIGEMKKLSAWSSDFHDYFSSEAAKARGRLAERLAFVARG
jgi:hypothetical protein